LAGGASIRSAPRIPDTAVADLRHSVNALRKHRLAHRQLRTDNVILDDDDQAWLIGFGLAELGTTDNRLDIDVVE
jgi:glycosyltransferase 2 family protein